MPISDRHPLIGRQGRPEFFQIVEGSDLGPEQMHHDIAGVDQHPVALRHALDPQIAETLRFKTLDQLVGNGRDMAVRAAGGDDHLIGESALAVKIDRGDVFGLGVIEAG
jgi:hypothetical protein